MMKELIAIMVIALVGLTGSATAAPADLVGYDTPVERMHAYQAEMNDIVDHLDACSFENGGYVTSRIMYSYILSYHTLYSNLLNDYTVFYYRILAA